MIKHAIATTNAPAAVGPYAQAVVGAGLVFLSGQVPIDPRSGKLVSGGVEEQTHQVMKNLSAVLEAAGTDLSRVVKSTVYLTDMADFAELNRVYATYFEGLVPPARATVGVAALPLGARLEIEMTALV